MSKCIFFSVVSLVTLAGILGFLLLYEVELAKAIPISIIVSFLLLRFAFKDRICFKVNDLRKIINKRNPVVCTLRKYSWLIILSLFVAVISFTLLSFLIESYLIISFLSIFFVYLLLLSFLIPFYYLPKEKEKILETKIIIALYAISISIIASLNYQSSDIHQVFTWPLATAGTLLFLSCYFQKKQNLEN